MNVHMISVAELDDVAAARLADAKALFAAGRFDGAAYLGGYAVEVSLKARICRALNWNAFPSTSAEFRAYRSFQTHDLDVLLRLSGQKDRISSEQFEVWNAVAGWVPESRYTVAGTARKSVTSAVIAAIETLLVVL